MILFHNGLLFLIFLLHELLLGGRFLFSALLDELKLLLLLLLGQLDARRVLEAFIDVGGGRFYLNLGRLIVLDDVQVEHRLNLAQLRAKAILMSGDAILGRFVLVHESGVLGEAAEASFDCLPLGFENFGLCESFLFHLNSLELE